MDLCGENTKEDVEQGIYLYAGLVRLGTAI
jgi:hypothetical protein